VAAGRPGGDGAAIGARLTAGPDRGAAGLPPGHGAPLDQPVQPRRCSGTGRPAAVRAAPARRRRLTGRIAALLARPGPWTLPRIRRYLGWPQVSARTLYRRVRLVAIWRRPRLTARGDPDHDHVVAQIVKRLLELPRRAVVLAEDETHLHLLPHVRASWTLRTARPDIPTPGKNRQVTVFGAIEVTTGAWVYRLGRRCAADFIALLDQLLKPARSMTLQWPPTSSACRPAIRSRNAG
jgi:hypothetical protein